MSIKLKLGILTFGQHFFLTLPSPSLSLAAFSYFTLWGSFLVVPLFFLNGFHLHFVCLFSLVFICIFVFTSFARVNLAPFSASFTFVWRAQALWLSRLSFFILGSLRFHCHSCYLVGSFIAFSYTFFSIFDIGDLLSFYIVGF